MKFYAAAACSLWTLATTFSSSSTLCSAMEASNSLMYRKAMPIKMAAHQHARSVNATRATVAKIKKLTRGGVAKCDPTTGLAAGEFPCKNMDLVSFLTGEELGSPYASNENPLISATFVNDIWGWTDSKTKKEYALVGMWDGTSIVDISNPRQPKTICFVETTGGVVDGVEGKMSNSYRDIKVVGDTMYVGAEVSFHGIQAFDLTRVRQLAPRSTRGKTVRMVSPDFITPQLNSTHNLVAAPEAGKIIAVGMGPHDKTCPQDQEGVLASMAIFDVSKDQIKPTFETCVYIQAGFRGYVHDAHCIRYNGPDTKYKDTNICALFMEAEIVLYNLDALTIINRFRYRGYAYVHQGWFSEDHATLYADDELDEVYGTSQTGGFSTCYIFNMTALDAKISQPIKFVTSSDDSHPSVDHNLYVKDGHVYQAAYTGGARVRKIMPDTTLEEVAYFDGEGSCECVGGPGNPECSCDFFSGTWTYFPYYDSGITIAGGVSEGLFLLKPNLDPVSAPPPTPNPTPAPPKPKQETFKEKLIRSWREHRAARRDRWNRWIGK